MSKGAIIAIVVAVLWVIGFCMQKCEEPKKKVEEERIESNNMDDSNNDIKNSSGTWSMFRCQYNGKKYDIGELKSYPKKIVLNEDGTGIMYWEGAKNVNFNWSSDNGYMSFSGTELNIQLNSQGYIVCSCAAIKWDNFGIIWADFFFQK